MSISVKIFKPKSVNNVLSDRFKVVSKRNGIQDSVKFADTKKQAEELQRRARARLRRKR